MLIGKAVDEVALCSDNEVDVESRASSVPAVQAVPRLTSKSYIMLCNDRMFCSFVYSI